MTNKTYMRALVSLMYQNYFDLPKKDATVHYECVYVVDDHIYFEEYVAKAAVTHGQMIEQVFIEEARQKFEEDPNLLTAYIQELRSKATCLFL